VCHSETVRSLQGRGIPEADAFVPFSQRGKPASASGISHPYGVRNDSLERCRIYVNPESRIHFELQRLRCFSTVYDRIIQLTSPVRLFYQHDSSGLLSVVGIYKPHMLGSSMPVPTSQGAGLAVGSFSCSIFYEYKEEPICTRMSESLYFISRC
jgi:hypothetical protein